MDLSRIFIILQRPPFHYCFSEYLHNSALNFQLKPEMKVSVILVISGTRLLCERGAGERGVGILRAGSKNYCQNFINIGIPLKIEILMADFFKNSIFGEIYDLLPWVQKSLLPSKIEESTYEREGELKIKSEKRRSARNRKRDGEFKIK
jgi:hypothetical protein